MLRDLLSSSSEKKDEGVESQNAKDLEWALRKRDAMMGQQGGGRQRGSGDKME